MDLSASAVLDNILVHQKNQILSLIRDGEWEIAGKMLDLLEELWKTTRYDYKTRELRQFIKRCQNRLEIERIEACLGV